MDLTDGRQVPSGWLGRIKEACPLFLHLSKRRDVVGTPDSTAECRV